ncbi:MAG: rhombosortase [Pseudomonadota bacterium]
MFLSISWLDTIRAGIGSWRALAILVLAISLAGLGAHISSTVPGGDLAWDRMALSQGQAWRLVTGHLVHLNVNHSLMNLAALALIMTLFGATFGTLGWLKAWLGLSLSISLLLLWLDPGLTRYVGASGVLHGLVVLGALREIRQRPVEALILLVGLALKIGWEQMAGPAASTEALIGGRVIVNAHLYGAIAGLVAGVVLAVADRFSTPA